MMIGITDINQINEFVWEIPASYRQDMNVPVRLFSSRQMVSRIMSDRSLEQAVNAATLPGLVDKVYVMPDIHQGYGFPIGGVAATRYPEGVISPGGIGYDINCGVRLLTTTLTSEEATPRMSELANQIYQLCPSGVGKDGMVNLSSNDLDEVLHTGSMWALRNGYATEDDLLFTEEQGNLGDAEPRYVSDKAKKRGYHQLGSLGSGNHFIEVDIVADIFDANAAECMGLYKNCLTVQVHCGSRGLGHQVCTDYVQKFQRLIKEHGIHLPDRELIHAPLESPEGSAYLGAMRAAGNFAFANRQLLTYAIRQAFRYTFPDKVNHHPLTQVYDISHNTAKIEIHTIGNKATKVCVHRKGATRAFGQNHEELPERYMGIGQPVLVPGSMGTASWVLTGTTEGMSISLGSCCHGAGRIMSRSQAKKEINGNQLHNDLHKQGVQVKAHSMSGLAEEAPAAYKDVDEVVETVCKVGIARKVAKLIPLVVIKG